ncbi:MAG TPA: hypothetical protein VFJ15_05835 [Oleiagrimonas sp.]|nr:hypothetical protein [Oleiagrimonas sp.]
MADIGVVAALPAEAATWPADSGFQVVVAGPGMQRATAAARGLLAAGATRLISWGVAGGLTARLRPGDLVLADRVASADGVQIPDRDWCSEMVARLQPLECPLTVGSVWTHAHAVTSLAEKQRLAANGHAIVDMEAAAVASVARAAGVPFVVIKAVCDPAGRALPACAPRLLHADGRVRVSAVAMTLASGPRMWRHLRQMHRDFDAACGGLRKAAACLSVSCPP